MRESLQEEPSNVVSGFLQLLALPLRVLKSKSIGCIKFLFREVCFIRTGFLVQKPVGSLFSYPQRVVLYNIEILVLYLAFTGERCCTVFRSLCGQRFLYLDGALLLSSSSVEQCLLLWVSQPCYLKAQVRRSENL